MNPRILGAYLVHVAQTLRAQDQELQDTLGRLDSGTEDRESVLRAIADATRTALLYLAGVNLMIATYLDSVPDAACSDSDKDIQE